LSFFEKTNIYCFLYIHCLDVTQEWVLLVENNVFFHFSSSVFCQWT